MYQKHSTDFVGGLVSGGGVENSRVQVAEKERENTGRNEWNAGESISWVRWIPSAMETLWNL